METKTQEETLVSLYNDQLELVLNRRAGIRILKKLPETKVLTQEFNPETMKMDQTTVAMRLKTFQEMIELEEMRLTEYGLMREENQKVGEKSNTGVEQE